MISSGESGARRAGSSGGFILVQAKSPESKGWWTGPSGLSFTQMTLTLTLNCTSQSGGGPAQQRGVLGSQERGLAEQTHRELYQQGLSRNTGRTSWLRQMHWFQQRLARGQSGLGAGDQPAPWARPGPLPCHLHIRRMGRCPFRQQPPGGEERQGVGRNRSVGWSCTSGHLPSSDDLDWNKLRGC